MPIYGAFRDLPQSTSQFGESIGELTLYMSNDIVKLHYGRCGFLAQVLEAVNGPSVDTLNIYFMTNEILTRFLRWYELPWTRDFDMFDRYEIRFLTVIDRRRVMNLLKAPRNTTTGSFQDPSIEADFGH